MSEIRDYNIYQYLKVVAGRTDLMALAFGLWTALDRAEYERMEGSERKEPFSFSFSHDPASDPRLQCVEALDDGVLGQASIIDKVLGFFSVGPTTHKFTRWTEAINGSH